MARARNIKPGLFTNDVLAENNCPLGRMLFIGLWCLADYKGDLEWRASRIKVQLLPYDECDIKQLAINLDKSGFVRFYSDGEKMYLRINNFEKHQNPHPNEKKKGSDIPAYTESMRQVVDLKGLTINHDKSRPEGEDSISDPADSLIPHPDSLVPEREDRAATAPPPQDESEPVKPKQKRGKRLPDDWSLTDEYRAAARDIRPDLLPVIDTVAGKFADYWHSKTGTSATKLDWLATWRNWLRNEKQITGGPHAEHQPNRRESLAERSYREAAEIHADIEAREAGERVVGSDAATVRPQVGQSGWPRKTG